MPLVAKYRMLLLLFTGNCDRVYRNLPYLFRLGRNWNSGDFSLAQKCRLHFFTKKSSRLKRYT